MNENKPMVAIEKNDDGIYIAKILPKKILEELQILEIGQQLSDTIKAGATKLVIDFSNVDHLSSAALGMLLNMKKQIETNQGALRLSYIRSAILQVFKITRLNELFFIHKTTEEAIDSFKG
jgi:anti-sigma B factor antagonist